MKVALVSTWTTSVVGREAQTIAYAREADDFWSKQAAAGKCSEPEWLWAMKGPHMWMVKGEMDDLQMLMATPEAMRLITMGTLLCQNFEWGYYVCGREQNLALFEAVAKELSLA